MSVLFSAISIAVTAITLVVLLYRILQNSGVKLSHFAFMQNNNSIKYEPNNKELIKIFVYAILFRVFILIAGFVVYCIFTAENNTFSLNQFYDNWVIWDADNYIRISDGYSSYMENNDFTTLVFFPLYPMLMKIFDLFIGNIVITGLTVSSLCYAVSCVYLYKLVCLDYGKSTAQKAVVLMSIFPFGFFSGAIMSEGTFLMTMIMTLYYIRKHNFPAVGICGMFAALSRSAGVFLIVPATVEFIEEYKIFENLKDIKKTALLIAKKWTWLLLIPVGILIYLFINYKVAGNPFEFLRLEKVYWNQTGQPFFKTVGSLWKIICGKNEVSVKTASFVSGTIILFAMYGVMIYGVKKHRTMYMTWYLLYLIVNTTMSWPLSLPRYLSINIPFFIVTADACEKNSKLYTALVMAFGILFGIYLTGYLTWKQIM